MLDYTGIILVTNGHSQWRYGKWGVSSGFPKGGEWMPSKLARSLLRTVTKASHVLDVLHPESSAFLFGILGKPLASCL
jgi:hypothetical protein